MENIMKTTVLFAVFYILMLYRVESLNYGPRRRFPGIPQPAASTREQPSTSAERNETAADEPKRTPGRPVPPYTVFYSQIYPQSRGGKNLNLTLPTDSHPVDRVQPRIVNHPELYPYFATTSQRQPKASNPVIPDRPRMPNDTPFTNPPDDSDESKGNRLTPPPDNRYEEGKNTRVVPSVERYNKGMDSSPPAPAPPPDRYFPIPGRVFVAPAPGRYYKGSDTLPRPPPSERFPKPTEPADIPQDRNKARDTVPPMLTSPPTPSPPSERYYNRPPNVYMPPSPGRYYKGGDIFGTPSPPPERFSKVTESTNVPVDRYNMPRESPPPSPPPRFDKTVEGSFTPPTPKYNKNRMRYKLPPQRFKPLDRVVVPSPPAAAPVPPASPMVAPVPPVGKLKDWPPCFCVPYYLCKNGVVNSGGRSVAAQRTKRTKRAFNYGFVRNRTVAATAVQPKIMNRRPEDPAPPQSDRCDADRVCCRLSFGGDEDIHNDDSYYPVATPPPEPVYTEPPRYPNRRKEIGVCGVRRVMGVLPRLQPQYSADVADFGEYPWQIAVLKKVEGEKSLYLCGGVLVSYQWVATAAHCVKKNEGSRLLIRLGEWDVNRKDEVYPYAEEDVDSIVIHPEFDPETLYNDLALVRLRNSVDPRTPHVTPACLPQPGEIYEDQKCWVSGWGKDFFGPQGEYQNVLKEVDVPVLSRSVCMSSLRSTNLGPSFLLHPGFLCAGGEAGKDACTGDGGSPLVCKSDGIWYVLGLVSWGIGCGAPGVPGVYVNILYYLDWINSIIGR